MSKRQLKLRQIVELEIKIIIVEIDNVESLMIKF